MGVSWDSGCWALHGKLLGCGGFAGFAAVFRAFHWAGVVLKGWWVGELVGLDGCHV